MKRFILTFIMIFSLSFIYAQTDSLQVNYAQEYEQNYIPPYYEYDESYLEIGLGSFIPNDDSNSLLMFDIELGKYLNKYVGIGLNVKYGEESEFNDRLGYIGPKLRFRINYSPRNDLDLDIHTGLGYGWLDYNLYGYDYYSLYKTINYVVPNLGLTGYINLGKTISLGIEPSYFWYISTNKDESENVGVWNIMGKLKFRF